MLAAPFYPSVFLADVSEGGLKTYEIAFNQGYIFDYMSSNGTSNPIKIEGMEQSFEITENERDVYFVVTISVDVATGGVTSASFEKKQTTAAETDPLKILGGGDTAQVSVTREIVVCKFWGGFVEEMYLRDNIHWWGRKVEQRAYDNSSVGHPIVSGSSSRPLQLRCISGVSGAYLLQSFSVINVDDAIVISGILPTGSGVMYGKNNAEEPTYNFLLYPSTFVNGSGWHDVLEAGDHVDPSWARKQYLPQSADGAAQGDILYWDATAPDGNGAANGAWVVLPAPTPTEMSSFYGDPVLHHDGTAPYWGQDDYYL